MNFILVAIVFLPSILAISIAIALAIELLFDLRKWSTLLSLLIAPSAKAYGMKSAFQKKAGIFLAMQSSFQECKAYIVVTGTAL